ncbi:MAG: pilus assembly protein TadG-related protein [Henriciella sp.]
MVSPKFWSPMRDTSGQVAVIFALLTLPILMMTALAIDAARQVNTHRHLDIATDLASLAGVRAMEDASLSDQAVEAIVENYYFAQLTSTYSDLSCGTPEVTVDRTTRTVSVEGNCALPTIFGLYSPASDTVAIAQGAVSETDLTELELALILDVSHSMIGPRGEAMKDAAKNFVSTLLDDTTKDRVRISIVPFATSVNAGIYGNRAMGRFDHDDRFGDGVDKVCVREREGPEAHSDARPMIGQFVRENMSSDPIFRCLDESVLPLSNEPDPMHDLIDGLTPDSGGSAGQVALAWAWYTLSPNWHSIWPAAAEPASYGEPDLEKVVVLLSDGKFNKYYDLAPFSELYARAEAIRVCNGISDENIEIYVVDYLESGGGSGLEWWTPTGVLQRCASSGEHYFRVVDNGDFQSVLTRIASRLKWARLKG